MKIAIEEVEAMLKRRAEINTPHFTEIEWTLNGETLTLKPGVAEEMRFTGLSNVSLIECYAADRSCFVGFWSENPL